MTMTKEKYTVKTMGNIKVTIPQLSVTDYVRTVSRGKIEGVDLVNKADVTIMGISVRIKYAIHDPAYVEWKLEEANQESAVEGWPDDEMELLNVLLRVHYSDFIEAACREQAYYDSYAASAAADDWADSLSYAKGIQGLFKDEDIPF